MTEDADQKKTEEQSAAFDWKKAGFDLRGRLTLKHNPLEAEQYRAKADQKAEQRIPNKLKKPLNPNRLRSKIKDAMDEDDEEEYDMITPLVRQRQMEDNALYNALDEKEKRLFMQQNTDKQTRMQQEAGKMEALHLATNLAREVGVHDLNKKTLEDGMQEAVFDPKSLHEKVVQKEVSNKLGIKGKIEDGKIIQAARGIKKIEQMGGKSAANNMHMQDVVRAGEEKLDDKQLAELILEKSGQDVKKRKLKKTSSKVKLEYLETTQNKDKNKNKVELQYQKNDDLGR